MSGSGMCNIAGVLRLTHGSPLHERGIILICSGLLVSLQFYHDNGVFNCQGLFFLTSYFSVLSSDLALIMDTLIAQSYFWDPSEFYFFTFNVNCDMNCFYLFFTYRLFFRALHLKRAQSRSRNLLYIYIFIHFYTFTHLYAPFRICSCIVA